jgi:hypothetical protein
MVVEARSSAAAALAATEDTAARVGAQVISNSYAEWVIQTICAGSTRNGTVARSASATAFARREPSRRETVRDRMCQENGGLSLLRVITSQVSAPRSA